MSQPNTHQPPRVRAPKPNQHERTQRQLVIDNLIGRALRGVLTIPEAAVLADYVRAERQLSDKTRRSLAHTTRALQRHREAADAEIRRLEERVAELTGASEVGNAPPSEPAGARLTASQPANGTRDARPPERPADGRTADAA